jgi:hypothetical protein
MLARTETATARLAQSLSLRPSSNSFTFASASLRYFPLSASHIPLDLSSLCVMCRPLAASSSLQQRFASSFSAFGSRKSCTCAFASPGRLSQSSCRYVLWQSFIYRQLSRELDDTLVESFLSTPLMYRLRNRRVTGARTGVGCLYTDYQSTNFYNICAGWVQCKVAGRIDCPIDRWPYGLYFLQFVCVVSLAYVCFLSIGTAPTPSCGFPLPCVRA